MRTLLTSLIIMFALTGCASDDPSATTLDPTTITTIDGSSATTTGTVAVESDPALITIENFSFGDPIEVAAGSTVTVVNEDSATHTWTSDDGVFDSGSLASGERFSHTFDEPGEYSFSCTIHPGMTGTVTVTG